MREKHAKENGEVYSSEEFSDDMQLDEARMTYEHYGKQKT